MLTLRRRQRGKASSSSKNFVTQAAERPETSNSPATRNEPSNRFVIMEGWQNQAAYEVHDKGTTMSEFQAALKPIRNSPTNPHTLLPFANVGPRIIPLGAHYMVEHVDFRGGDPAVAEAAVAYVKALAESSQKEAGALRYDIYRRPAPRIITMKWWRLD